MKKLSILVSKKSIGLIALCSSEFEYIYDYIDFLLSPYRKLGYFKYNTLTDCYSSIDGNAYPELLLTKIHPYIASSTSSGITSFWGNDNFFLNGESFNFSLSQNEYDVIKSHTMDYFLFFALIHD